MGELKVFDGSSFVSINFANAPRSDRMTIVLTHGFDSHPEQWAQGMAEKTQAQGVWPDVANILGWDWREAAVGPLTRLPIAHGHTREQGIGLGQALQDRFDVGYAKQIHFIGHSLGTLVNAAAANYLQGMRTAHEPVSPAPWLNAPMHMTLFDHAQLANAVSEQTLFDGLTTGPYEAVSSLRQSTTTLQDWASPVPLRFAWLDNYVSLVGFYQPRGVNIVLQKGYGEVLPSPIHSYPTYWYGLSIPNPSASLLGFRRSYEYDQATGGGSSFPPSSTAFPPGVTYRQVPASADPRALELLPADNSFETFGILPQVAVQGAVSTVQVVGDVVVQVRETAEAARQRVTAGFNYAANVALQGGQMLVDLYESPVLRFLLRARGVYLPSPLVLAGGTFAFTPASGAASGSPAMAWLPIHFPANATAMAFDFTMEGDPMDDVLVCGIGTNNLFSLGAKYIPTNTISASRLMDVSAWSGTTNELFFGFMGGTSTNATLVIENIRFYSITAPRLEIARGAGDTVLSWPSSAGGYVVETTPALDAPTWEALTSAPVLSGSHYFQTNSSADQSRFFRLRVR